MANKSNIKYQSFYLKTTEKIKGVGKFKAWFETINCSAWTRKQNGETNI